MSFKRPIGVTILLLAFAAQGYSADKTQTIEVVADKLQVQNLVDRKVYSVVDNLQAVTGSAADVLNDIPSVEVDADGLLTLRGDNKVMILVDGKPSAQFTGTNAGLALQQFPGNDIEKIEVMTNPPPQYKAEGTAGIINIITKKSRGAGFSGSVQFSGGARERYVTGANVNYSDGPLSMSGTVNMRQEVRQRVVTDQRTAVDPSSNLPVLSHETLVENLHRRTPTVKAGVDYKLGAN